ncbi:MAG TPA: permease prefix domain 1-containing protein [Naasia sp.]|jgi:hypothetical protein
MTTLTDRYVYAALRTLPEQQRPDIERELRGSIADAVDARRDSGEPDEAAETAVLTELGDPIRLAAGYADRPLHLIGPDLFLDWWRLLKVLWAVVLPCVVLGVTIANLIAGTPPGGIVGAAIGVTISAAVHIGFWVTFVFVLVERSSSKRMGPFTTWTPAMLPQLPAPGTGKLSELVASAVLVALAVGALIWQQFNSVFQDDAGNAIPLFNPELWSFWLPYFIVLLIAEIPFALAVWRTGRWTFRLAAINTVLNLLFAVPAVWLLLTDQVVNPAFAAATGGRWLAWSIGITATVVLAICVYDVIDGFLKARRASAVTAA